jgi:hypothetical protein
LEPVAVAEEQKLEHHDRLSWAEEESLVWFLQKGELEEKLEYQLWPAPYKERLRQAFILGKVF